MYRTRLHGISTAITRIKSLNLRIRKIAIDHSELAQLDELQIAAVVALMQSEGMHASLSSIHINGWYGEYNKLASARWIVQQPWQRNLDAVMVH